MACSAAGPTADMCPGSCGPCVVVVVVAAAVEVDSEVVDDADEPGGVPAGWRTSVTG